jgi:DNA-binding response OmpR family regulator
MRSAAAAARAAARRGRTPGEHETPEPWQPPAGARRILLVEDHEDSAETLALILSMKGYQVTVARTVAEAARLASGCDLVISDISLPDGTGLDLMRQLQREPALPAIAMSGYGTELDRRRSRDAGFAEHLTKPVNIDQLLATLRRIAPSAPPTPAG